MSASAVPADLPGRSRAGRCPTSAGEAGRTVQGRRQRQVVLGLSGWSTPACSSSPTCSPATSSPRPSNPRPRASRLGRPASTPAWVGVWAPPAVLVPGGRCPNHAGLVLLVAVCFTVGVTVLSGGTCPSGPAGSCSGWSSICSAAPALASRAGRLVTGPDPADRHLECRVCSARGRGRRAATRRSGRWTEPAHHPGGPVRVGPVTAGTRGGGGAGRGLPGD